MNNKRKENTIKNQTTGTESKDQVVDDVTVIAEEVNIVLDAKAGKLNPKNGGFIHFEVKLEKNELLLRMKDNDSGGLYSKEWINLQTIISILDAKKSTTDPFNSTILKSVFKSGSANNASFLAAILRSKELALIAAVP